MNKLLPNIDKLIPITDDSKTFYDNPLKKEFHLLTFKDQLQVLNDIVRQSMIYTENINPLSDVENLIGDDYTSALVSMNYLKKLKVGKNHRVAFARCKSFECNNATFKVVLLVDNDDKTYLFDATPKVGYKAGYVELCKDLYDEYIVIKGELESIFKGLRNINFILDNSNISDIDLHEYKTFFNYALKYDTLKPYVNKLNDKIKNKFNVYILRPNFIFNNEKNYDKIKMLKQIWIWTQELKDLISSDISYKRQIELAQNITRLQNIISGKNEPTCKLDTIYNMTELTPRIFLESGSNLVIIKPSAYLFNWEEEVKERFLEGKYSGISNYYKSLGHETNLGLLPMKLFHPHGYKYVREMTGPTELFLVNRSAKEISLIKKKLRQEFKQRIKESEVLWFDNELIKWNPICLNFAHSSDDPCEACMGYTCPYPEYQVMTRFMYPNPLIIEEEKNGRVRI